MLIMGQYNSFSQTVGHCNNARTKKGLCCRQSTTGMLRLVTGVVMFTLLMLDGPAPAAAQDYVQQMSQEGYRLQGKAQYLVVASKKVRPGSIYMVQATMMALYHKEVSMRAMLSKDGDEYASSTVRFTSSGTRSMELYVPDYIQNGTHRLLVEGLVGQGVGKPLFVNETRVEFDSRYVAVFIQTDRSIYYPTQSVLFRVVGTSPSLRPVYGTITIYLLDAGRNVVMRWLSQQLNMGMFEGKFDIAYPVKTGKWALQVDAFGHIYEQEFDVQFYWPRRFEVNVTTPLFMTEDEWGLIGHLYGEHQSGRAATGNGTVRLRVAEENGDFVPGEIIKAVPYVTGTVPFDFSMKEIKEKFGEVAGKDLHVKGWIFDWMWLETQNGTSVTRVVRDGVKVEILGRDLRTFKPGVPFTVYMAVSRTDGTPYDGSFNRLVVVTEIHEGGSTQKTGEQKVLIPEDNIIRYTVKPNKADTKIYIRAWHTSSPKDQDEIQLYRYFSPNDQYISIQTTTEAPKVNEYAIFTMHTSYNVPEVNYLVMGAGGIIIGDTLRMSSTQKTFSIAVSRQMAPMSRILAYYISAGEVVVDALNFYVKDTRLTNATLTLNSGKDFSGDTIEIVARADPGAYIMLVGHDYELHRRGGDTFLTEKKVIEGLREFDEPNQAPFEHVWWHHDERWYEHVFFPSPTNGIDTVTTFDLAGLVAMSDKNLTFRDDLGICNKTLGLGRCVSGGCYILNNTCDGTVNCQDGTDEMNCPDLKRPVPRRHGVDTLHKMGRYYSDVDWLWKRSWVKPNGQAEVKIDVPESTNPYVISGFVIHPEEGLTLVQGPVMHDATRTFLMLVEAPSDIRRGEQVGIRVSLFNGQDERIEVIVTLHGSDEYRFVNVEDNGFVRSYAPRTTGGDHQTMILLEAGANTYVFLPVVPTMETGEFTVSISAYTFIDSDHEQVTISVSMDGMTNGDHTPYLIDLVNQGSIIIPDFDIPIPEIFFHPEQKVHLYVPGSEAASFNLFGDVVSPGFFMDYFTTNDIIGVPHDSAEGYMTDFALNLQTLKYLQATNALSVDATVKALEYMKSILMRQYAYMADDGSFQVFRRESKPSIWVSAFISKTLNEAQASEWSEDLYIPIELLNKIVGWIAGQQNSTTGHFEDTSGVVYDRSLQPITIDANGVEHNWHVAITAYVTITLSHVSRLTGDAKTAADSARSKASEYLGEKYHHLTDPFQMAITAYAMTLADHRDKEDAFNKLKSMKRVDESVYWANKVIEPNPVEVVNTVFFMQARPYFENLGNAMSATSYALMLYLNKNEFEAATPIMKWMQTQRNALMKFSGTQDTLNALQALTEYALRETNRDIYQMQIDLESTSSPWWKHQITLNASTFSVLHEGSIPKAYGQMKAEARGTGYAMLQMDFGQNVERDWQVAGPEFASYEVEVDELRFSGHNSSIMDMTFCTRWVRPDLSDAAGMTVVAIQIPTGFIVARDSIMKIYNSHVPGLRRSRFRGGTLFTLFENMTQSRTCMEIRAERWYPAANVSIQQAINVYEYAETGLQKNTLYTVYTLFHQNLCQVCASFQCPYCPYYNHARHLGFSLVLLVMCLMTSFLFRHFRFPQGQIVT